MPTAPCSGIFGTLVVWGPWAVHFDQLVIQTFVQYLLFILQL